MKKLFLTALLAMSVPLIVRGTDIPIFPTGPVFRLNNLVWGQSGPQGFNNNFFFTPLSQAGYVCAYVFNNNPTNGHAYGAAIALTGDATSSSPSQPSWQFATAQGTQLFVGVGLSSSISASVAGAAQVSINLSGSVTQAGSPDTANLVISQSAIPCFAGNSTAAANAGEVSAIPSLQAIGGGLGQAWSITSTITNPASGQNILLLTSTGTTGQVSTYFDHVVLNSTAAAQVNIVLTNGIGTTCGVGTAAFTNIKLNSVLSPQNTLERSAACTANPTQLGTSLFTDVQVPVSPPVSFDLRGIISPPQSAGGVEVVMAAALTGTISVTIFFYEK